jgi:predicted dehydrogenase
MREIIASGGIGKLQRFTWIVTNWYRTQSYYESGGWRATWAGEGGGVLINQCPHQLDLLQWVLGAMPVSVRAVCEYGKWHDIEVEDDVTAFLRFESGATGVFITTTGETPGTNRFEVSGTGGKLLCENDCIKYYKNRCDSIEFSLTSDKGFATPGCDLVLDEPRGANPQHLGIINNFANAVLGLEPLFIDGREGIRGVELMNAIELSGWKSGAEVTLPVDEEEYLDYLNRFRAVSRFDPSAEDRVEDTSGTFEGAKI